MPKKKDKSKKSKPRPAAEVAAPVTERAGARVSAASVESPASFRAGPLIPGYDLDHETIADVAPVGPTEQTRRDTPPPSMRTPLPSIPPTATVEEIEAQIRDLELRLDKMIRQRSLPSATESARSIPAARSATSLVGAGTERSSPANAVSWEAPERRSDAMLPDSSSMRETARDMLSTDYYLRRWGRLGLRSRSEEVDEFGLDPKYEERYQAFFDFLHRVYFRVETEGLDHIPETGRCLIVANHSGGPLPYDGLMLRTTIKRDHASHREVRWLSEDFIHHLPFVGAAMNRVGAVRACPENAERLLSREAAVVVFPEGAKGIGKLFRDRYRLQRFGRGGFIRLCLRTQTPIVPCAIVGAEEANPLIYRIETLTKTLGIPYLPVTPTFPALGPIGLLPAPTKWKIRFGEPLSFEDFGPEAADDEILVGRLSDRVRNTIQTMLDRTLSERQSIWFG